MTLLKRIVKSVLFPIKHGLETAQLKAVIKSQKTAVNINIGAEKTLYKGWLSTNIENLNLLERSSFQNLFGKKKARRFLAEHVFEHISYEDALVALENCYEFLEDGGTIRIAVPDGYHPNPDYIKMVRPGGTGEGADDHKLLYNHKKLSEVLTRAGFKIRLLEYYDENGQFHFAPWDSEEGHIIRSSRYDPRFKQPIGYSSLIIDGIKD